MIRCTKCQTINPDDAVFCSSCASFLEWTGERISADEAGKAAEAPTDTAAEAETEVEAPVETPLGPGETPAEPVETPAETRAGGTTDLEAAIETPAEPSPPPTADEPAAAPAPPAEPAEPAPVEPATAHDEPAETSPAAAVAVEAAEAGAPAQPSAPAATVPSEPPQPIAPSAPFTGATTPGAEPSVGIPLEEPPARRPAPAPFEPRRPIPRMTPQQPSPPSDQPAARRPVILPAEPSRPRPQPTPAAAREPEARPGDLICSVCGTPNDPTRRFCRRCGNSLATAVVAARLPWYRRIFERRRRIAAAGERPRRMGEAGQPRRSVLRQLVPLAVVAVVAGAGVGYLFVPNLHQRVDSIVADLRLSFLPQIVDLHPPKASGNGVSGRTGNLAVDDNTATFWLADPTAGPPTLTVELGQPTNLAGLIFHSGSATDSTFTQHRRPKTLALTFPGSAQGASELDLKDQSEPQAISLDVRDVSTVVIRITDWFESGEGGDRFVALREIEFKARR